MISKVLFTFLWVMSVSYLRLVFPQMCKKDLMQLDFESILKYFRVTLPKKCRNEDVAKNLMKFACSIKMKKLKKYEQEFIELKGKTIFYFHISYFLFLLKEVKWFETFSNLSFL